MSEVEEQLRRNIRQIEDAEHLLDEVLDQKDAEVMAAEEEVEVQEERADSAERSLTTLREAVGRLLEPDDVMRHDVRIFPPNAQMTIITTAGAIGAVLAAHDGGPVPPTLTLEDAEGVVSGLLLSGNLTLVEFHEAKAELERLAQKGAGRG